MAIVAHDGIFNRQRLATEIETLKALVRDLERLMNGEDPQQTELADAPLIDNWDFDRRDTTCLVGTFVAHPRLGRIVPNGITSEGVVTLSFSGRKGQELVDIQAKQAAIFHASKASRRW